MNCIARFLLVGLLLCYPAAAGTPAKPPWHVGFKATHFELNGRKAHLVVPKSPAPGKPWIWRTEFVGHQPQADLALLEKGFHVAYIDMQNLYGGPEAMKAMDEFHDHVTRAFGLSPKTVLEGFSRGGLFALNWAARNPGKVATLTASKTPRRSWTSSYRP